MPTLYRLDEFARTSDGALTGRDLTRLLSLGFDLAPDVAAPTMSQLSASAFVFVHAGASDLTWVRGGASTMTATRGGAGPITREG